MRFLSPDRIGETKFGDRVNETERWITSFKWRTKTSFSPARTNCKKELIIHGKDRCCYDDSYDGEICILPRIGPTGRYDSWKCASSIYSRFASGDREMFE
jgi:hypothetical protein